MNGKSLYTKKDETLAVPISGEQKQELRQFAEDNKISMAQAARIILADFLEKYLLEKQAGSKERVAG